ncbi:MAG: hypothetical protein OEX02_19980, partial [Cyclobacteriaceae bacterium]|nr:hypothetical protein [Cyclobacteriaceae bacterium]
KGVTFHADFIGEHRGFSYGVYDTDNMIVYPRAEFTADRTISLFQKPLNFYVSVGNKQDVRLYEGLALYNLDAQGWDIHAQWAKFRITYHQLSDLHRWIGLNIGDSYDLLMSLEGLNITDTWKTDIKAGSYIYDSSPSLTEPTGIKVSASIYGGHTRFYLQSALRFNPDTSFQNKTAFVVGATRSLEQSRWSVDGRAEFRYYGSYFNRGYKNSVSYRDYNKGTYRNTIGRSLYPLSLYDRPFSQWAVFTEYTAMDVKGLTINGHGRYFMVKDLFLDLSADANLIMASGEKAFLYFYYTLAVGWQPLPDNYFMLGISNKGMNLDVHYPTHYFYKHPFFHLTLKRMIDHGN